VDQLAATATLGDSAEATAARDEKNDDKSGDDAWRLGEPIGRYRLIEKLGSGGMGVVYLADDPELDRRVALKLVRAGARGDAQADLVVEAQAMAKLQHPNIVTVYDVGLDRGRVFMAMELVAGSTLRAWLDAERRGWRAIAAMFTGAARGLAAAHRAGLVHRDFKPENVLIDPHGTARLTDFGLARPSDGSPYASAGTPRYMAPEQHDGEAVTAAADQFAFAAALWEALCGAPPFAGEDLAELARAKRLGRSTAPPRGVAPRWLIAALARALAPAPAARFPSLDALERTLVGGLGRRRRAALASTAVVAIAAAFAVGTLRAPSRIDERCGGAADQIAGTWNPAARDRVSAHLQPLGTYARGAAVELDRELAAFADRWVRSQHAACTASAHGELPAGVYERELACLERSRSALDAALDVLARVPADRVSDAVVSARSLPDATRCRAEALAQAPTPPPALARAAAELAGELERVRVRVLAHEPDAEAAATAVVERSERLGYPPLIARALLAQGVAVTSRTGALEAIPIFDRAARTALGADDDVTFVEAFARQIFAVGITKRDEQPPGAADALGALPLAEQIAQRRGTAAGFARALLFNNAGVARRAAGDNAGARAWFEKALAEPRTREGDVELASVYGNLALVTNDPAHRDALLTSQQAVLERLVGPDHVMRIDAEFKSSLFVANPNQAATALRAPCNRYRQLHPTTTQVRISVCAYRLAWLAEERNDVVEAHAWLAMVLASDRPRDLVARAYRSWLAGNREQAIRDAESAAVLLQGEWWTRIYAVDALIIAAQAQTTLGHSSEAIAALRRALAWLEQLTELESGADQPRRLARVRGQLATLEAEHDRVAAYAHARAAAAWYRQAGGYDRQVEALEAIARTTADGATSDSR